MAAYAVDDITAALKELRINYVPQPCLPYRSHDEENKEGNENEKFDYVSEIEPGPMIEIINEWLKAQRGGDFAVKLPLRRPNTAVFEDSVGRFVHCRSMRNLKRSLSAIVKSLLKIIKDLLVTDGSSCTPHRFFYLVKNDANCLYRDKATPENVNDCLIDLCCLFRCTRKSLKLNYAPSKCAFAGCIRYSEIDIDGKRHVTDCSGMLRSYQLHLDHIHGVEAPESCPPNFILVVEKLAVLEMLVEEEFFREFPCVLVTGCSEPDVQCRMFVKMLHDALQVPACALVDFNPHGVEIMRSYKVGSFNLAHESYALTVPTLKFVGLSAKDLQKYKIEIKKLMDISESGLAKAKSLVGEKWVKDDRNVFDSLSSNIAWMKKADIEVLDIEMGFCFLTKEYLPKKVKEALGK